MAVRLAAMRAVLVYTDLITVAGLAAACQLGECKRSVDPGIGDPWSRHVVGGLRADRDQLRGRTEHLDLTWRARFLHAIDDAVVGDKFRLGHEFVETAEQLRACTIAQAS